MRLRNLFGVAMLGGIYSFLSAALFIVMDAVDVAFTEAAVGAGISTVLALGALALVGSEERRPAHTPILPLVVVSITGATLIYGTLDMPPFMEPDNPVHMHVGPRYLERTEEEIHIPNVVSAVLASYRGYDTMGETTVVFTAAAGVMLLLCRPAPAPEGRRGGERMRSELILRVAAKVLIPFILLFGLYVQFHGEISPGGGFQAGVICAAAFILYALVFGLDTAQAVLPLRVARDLRRARGAHLLRDRRGYAAPRRKLPRLQRARPRPDPRAALGIIVRGARGARHRLRGDGGHLLCLCRASEGRVSEFLSLYNYWIVVLLMMLGFYTLIARGNLIKKMIGLNIFSTSVIIMYISLGKVRGGTAPILLEGRGRGLLQSPPARPDADRNRGGSRHDRGGPRPGGADQGGVRHRRGRRDRGLRTVMPFILPEALAHNLPALQIVIPLMSAPLCALLWRGRWAWAVAMVVSVVSFVIAVLLLRG